MSDPRADVAAMREWAHLVLPTDRDRWPAIINGVRSDLEWCLDYIVELEDKLREEA